MDERLKRLEAYIVSQLQQTSTWRGITLLLTASGVALKPEWGELITAGGLFLAGAIAVVFPDQVRRP